MGSQFTPFTNLINKVMIPIGSEEKPILEYIVRWLSHHGISEITLLVGYKWKQIRNYFGDESRFNVKVKIKYSMEQEQLGTTGALYKAIRDDVIISDHIRVWYGDIPAQVDLTDLINHYMSKDADTMLVIADKYHLPLGVINSDQTGRMVKVTEKPRLPIKVFIGIMVLKKESYVDTASSLYKRKMDLMQDIIPRMLERYRVYEYIYSKP